MSVIALVKSERGKDHVFLDGFTFRRAYYHSTVGGWKWRCTNKKCTANIYLDNELSMLPGGSCEHNHSILSRKRRYMKEMQEQVDANFALAAPSAPASSPKAEGDSQPVTNGEVSISKVPINGDVVNGLPPKPKRVRKPSTGVRRKRQKKLPPQEDIPEGTHHLAEDYEFPLDQCDSNTVFVNIFDNQTQQNQQVNRQPSSNTTAAEEQPENFDDPLSETFRTTAFPAICDLSPKDEEVNVPNEVIDVEDDDDGAEVNATVDEADNDCLLYEDVSLHRNVRLYPYHNLESLRNSSSRSLCVQNSRSRSSQGSIDLAHHIDTFFFAMAQSVKRLSTVNQIRAKQMITKVITKFEMDEAM